MIKLLVTGNNQYRWLTGGVDRRETASTTWTIKSQMLACVVKGDEHFPSKYCMDRLLTGSRLELSK
jgi:hypothetical protein